MKTYAIDLKNLTNNIYSTLEHLQGTNPRGERISFTNHYMMKDGKPFFGICGEFHFSRYDATKWEDEIIKIKMSGVNIIPTYIIWNHHEEIKGYFDWSGSKNIRRFVQLCKKHGLAVIMRIGPFDHGEVRNGGYPDWLYGEPCQVRSNDERYLFYVERLYKEIGEQLKGLFYQDGGPIIGVQLENEYCHAGSVWEITTGTSNEWIPNGQYDTSDEEHKKHIKILKNMAIEAGLIAPIYTGTGWGGAQAPVDTVLPLWGGYAFWPWIFYDESVKEHPVTPEYIYRNYRKPTYNFDPSYDPETVPFACCEMGGGMTCFYKYRFQLPYSSVDAMVNIKVAGGCNFVGYYMYHGGSNPKGVKTLFLNENATPKISYDFQAPLGEFGQVRESYSRLKRMHYFFNTFEKEFCPTKTVLPKGAEDIEPTDVTQLRYAVRVDNGRGFIFINNYQDHLVSPEKKDFSIKLELDNEILTVPQKSKMSIASEESCILPFNFQMENINLKYATAQVITKVIRDEEVNYFFFIPKGMKPEYCFDKDNIDKITISKGNILEENDKVFVTPTAINLSKMEILDKLGKKINVYTMTDEQSINFWKFDWQGKTEILLSENPILVDDLNIRFESRENEITIQTIDNLFDIDLLKQYQCIEQNDLITTYKLSQKRKDIAFTTKEIAKNKIIVNVNTDNIRGLKEILLRVDYEGDIGYAFVNNELINDNFANGATWDIGLGKVLETMPNGEIYISISPLKENQVIKSDSPMAARSEEAGNEIVAINKIYIQSVYEFTL